MPDPHHKDRWAWRRAHGLCGECGVVPSEKFSRCPLCRQFISETRKRWWRGGAKWSINRKRREQYAELGYRVS
jgi:hypothetical protein